MYNKEYYKKWCEKNKTRRTEYFREYNKTKRNPEYAKKYYKEFRDILLKKGRLKRIKDGWKPKIYKNVDNKVCYKCKKDNLPLILHNKTKYRQYYVCRECNKKRMREYVKTESGKKRVQEALKKSIKKHLDKQLARMEVAKALQNGKLVKALKCNCGLPTVEAHHEDYNKPLEVIWLCRDCHANLHSKKNLLVI